MGEMVIIWEHENNPGKCRTSGFKMKIRSLTAVGKVPRGISALPETGTLVNNGLKRGKNILNMLANKF